MLRPIICICNDQHAASLAKLRPHAHQIRFSRPADLHTVKRLREVCELEGLNADSRALATLVGVARGDLRGCLNTLQVGLENCTLYQIVLNNSRQFVKSRNEEVTESVIRAATVGMKEAEGTVTSVLNSLFAPMTRKRVKELAITDDGESRFVSRLSREVESSGRETGVAIGTSKAVLIYPGRRYLCRFRMFRTLSESTAARRQIHPIRKSKRVVTVIRSSVGCHVR